MIEERKHFFDERYRDLGDCDWVVRALRAKMRMKMMRHYTSVFTETGENMNLKPNAVREKAAFYAEAPALVRAAKPLIKRAYHLKRFLQGGYFEKPFSYEIYTKTSPSARARFDVAKPTPCWNRVPLKAEHALGLILQRY